MAGLQIQEDSNQGVSDVIITSKGGKGVSTKDETILVRGNLHKLGKRFKGWHQRYFEVQGSHMYYYKNATKKECLGEINLLICFYCEPSSEATFGSPFELRTVQRSHVLAARSKDEMQQWIQVIKEQMSPNESEAKKGTGKKSAKPKRWESFKNTFAISTRQRSQSPAVETRDQKKTAKKSFMNRFKTKKSSQRSPDHPLAKRPLSFTGADEKHQDTLDVFARFDVSKSLPSSPVSKRKKQSVGSIETATPISPMSVTSGSPFATGGGITTDSQTSTPAHAVPVTQDSPASSAAGQTIQIRVDVEDTSEPTAPVIPVIVEPSDEPPESPTDATKPAEPAKPDIVVESVESPTEQVVAEEEEVESFAEPAEPVEPVVPIDKEVESGNEPVEPAEPVVPMDTAVESPVEPAEPVVLEKESETTEEPTIPVEASATVEKIAEADKSPEEPESPVEQVVAFDKVEVEAERPTEMEQPAVREQEEEEEEKKVNERPATAAKPAVIIENKVEQKIKKKPALPVKPASVKEKETEKTASEKPTKPAKPAAVTETEVERTANEKPVEPDAKPAAVSETQTVEEPFIPKYLKDRHFQWDRIREILETAPESTERDSYGELPPQDVSSWIDQSSSVDQLRAFLLVCT